MDGGEELDTALRGRLKLERRTGDRIVIGDRVEVGRSGDAWVIEGVAERVSELVRRGFGGRRPKVIAANLDAVLAVVAAADPDPSSTQVDRLLVVAEASDQHPMLVVNKSDLSASTASRLRALYEGIGYRVVVVSVVTGEGLEELAHEVCHGTTALIGPSGAGKSSLLNALEPGLHLRTGELSHRTGAGRHTTVGARLLSLACGGLVADTPGFADVGTWGVAPEAVERCFPELVPLLGECRFRNCTHLQEPDCAVRAAVREGRIAASRYESYVTLRGEAGSDSGGE
jgi:ribosome biogenesis GTPase